MASFMTEARQIPIFRAARCSRLQVSSSSLIGIGLVFMIATVYHPYTVAQQKSCKKIRLVYGSSMSPSKTLPVRLSDDLIARLDAAAKKSEIPTRTDVIKICLTAFLRSFEAHGKICLPIDYKEIVKQEDGRTHRYDEERKQLELRVAEPRAEYRTKPKK